MGRAGGIAVQDSAQLEGGLRPATEHTENTEKRLIGPASP